jgi:hypothetical protein
LAPVKNWGSRTGISARSERKLKYEVNETPGTRVEEKLPEETEPKKFATLALYNIKNVRHPIHFHFREIFGTAFEEVYHEKLFYSSYEES